MHIVELRLTTSNAAAQREFYAGVLGMEARGIGHLSLQAGATRLIFEQAEDFAHRHHFALNIPENQFAQAKAWIAARVLLLKDSSGADEYDFADWNAHALYFRDPAGNIVEFIARHALSNASAEPFGSRSLLSVSEIGLGVDDVREAVGGVQSTLRQPVYDGLNSDTFTAVGDEHGLFIVVPLGRIWYPETGVPATAAPVNVTLMGEAERDYTVPGMPYHLHIRAAPGT